MKVKAVALALALMTSTSLVAHAQPADKTVWRVGVLDGSSREFAGGEPHVAVHFVGWGVVPWRCLVSCAPVAWAGKPPDPTSAPRAIARIVCEGQTLCVHGYVFQLIEHSSVPALRI